MISEKISEGDLSIEGDIMSNRKATPIIIGVAFHLILGVV